MLLLTQGVALPLAIHARAYFKAGDPAGVWFWPLLGFLLAGLNALFVSADLFNLYVTLELVGLAAIGLVAAGGGTQQVAAALRYLFATLLGSGAYLLGVALLYGAYGTVSSATLLPLVTAEAPRLVWIAAGLMVTGLLLKTALFPFHFWLPPAHGGAPAPVSALLSALVVKASFYLILRLWLGPLQALLPKLCLAAGAARRRGDLLGFLAGDPRRQGEAPDRLFDGGATRLPVPDLSAAAGARCAAGRGHAGVCPRPGQGRHVRGGRGDDQGNRAGHGGRAGRGGRAPAGDFLRLRPGGHDPDGPAAVSGFLAKWQIIDAALAQGHWVIAVVALAGGLLAAVYVFRVLRQAFLQAPVPDTATAVPRTLEWTAFALAAASVLLGLRGVELMQLVMV